MAITLRAARVNKGLSREKAAELIGVSANTLQNWETHKCYPDAVFIKKITEVYGMPYDDIIFCPSDTVKPSTVST